MSEKDALEVIVKYAPKDVHELILYYQGCVESELPPEELESFFISWINRIPRKSLSLYIFNDSKNKLNSLSDINDKNMEIINKYTKLGIIKKFEIINF